MKTVYNDDKNKIDVLEVFDDIFSSENTKIFSQIAKDISKSNKVCFYFRREDDDFLEEDELEIERLELPKYIEKNGYYTLIDKVDESRFESIALVDLQLKSYETIIRFWKYYNELVFFKPFKNFDWEEFVKYCKTGPRYTLYAIDFILNNFTKSLFIKGCGDSLLYVHKKDNKESVHYIDNLLNS